MTQSVQVNQLPDLGAPFLFPTQKETNQQGSYSVQTPYGFQLDLDFVKYVEEIESGHHIRRAPANSRQSSRGLKLCQKSPSVWGRASGWTSTESLSSPGSEDGKAPPRNRIGSAPCETHSISPQSILSPPPLSAGAKVPPPPPQRNPRVERTLLETSLRLQQEQSLQPQNGGHLQLAQPSKQGFKTLVPLLVTPANTLPTSSVGQFQSSWAKPSPQTSGRSTPASYTAVASHPPSQLQTVREQMATALRQLKEMEERLKGVPALEKEVAKLRDENDGLLLALQGKKPLEMAVQKQHTSVDILTQTIEAQTIPENSTSQSQGHPSVSPSHNSLSKTADFQKLTETLDGNNVKQGEPYAKVSEMPKEEVPAVEKKSVAVGDDISMESAVFYYSQGVEDASEGTTVELSDMGTGTEATLVVEEGVQTGVVTEDASVWVRESMLGLTSEAQREMATLQNTIRFQQESILVLEARLRQTDEDFGFLRAQENRRMSKVTMEKGVLVKPDTAHVQVETVSSKEHVAVSCCPEVMDACVGEQQVASLYNQGTQTDSVEPIRGSPVSTGSQWENLLEEPPEQKFLATALKRRQMTIAEYKVTSDKEILSSTEKKEEEEVEMARSSNPRMVGSLLKSIMKKDGSNSDKSRTTCKKSLQFVGILNGGYESTSSDEDEGEGSSSGASEAADVSVSSGEEEEAEAAAAHEETSDEERDINMDDSDSDDLIAVSDAPGEVKEKFELNSKMREACLILKNQLNSDVKTLKSKEVLSSTHTVQLEWFRISSAKMAQLSRVSDYLMAFSEVSSDLLSHIVNMTDGNGNTALHYSVSHSNFTVVGLLLDTGVCCVDNQNKAGYTAIMLAALSAVKEAEDMTVVKKLFSQGNVNAKASQAGQTGLMLAVSHGRLEMVRALLDCGADVNVQDDEGSTALMCASEHGRTEIVSLLLDQPSCDISIVDNVCSCLGSTTYAQNYRK
ncbi:KN motif and ankyrin repeat domain-containing protein 3 [Aplochiton taeniatus]